MKITTSSTVTFTERDLRNLQEELYDIGFGSDDMTGKKQPDEKWPTLAEFAELVGSE